MRSWRGSEVLEAKAIAAGSRDRSTEAPGPREGPVQMTRASRLPKELLVRDAWKGSESIDLSVSEFMK